MKPFRKPRSLSHFAICLLAWTAVAMGQTESWTPDDLILAEEAGQFEVSPDGKWVVWVKRQMDKEAGKRISNLFLSSLEDDQEIQLTRGKENHSSPQWSPDGMLIAFISSRLTGPDDKEPKSRIWLMRTRGGEPWPVTEIQRPVRSFQWRNSGSLVYVAQEDPTLYEQEITRRKDTSRVVDDAEREPPVRLFEFSLSDKKVRRITTNTDWIESVSLSRDGKRAAAVHRRSLSFAFDHKIPPVIRLVDLDTGTVTDVEPGRRILPRSPVWAADSSGFYYAIQYSSHPDYFTGAIELLEYYPLDSGKSVRIDLGWPNGIGGYGDPVQVLEDGFLTLLADGVRYRPARYRKDGLAWRGTDLSGEHVKNIWQWSTGTDGRKLVYHYSRPDFPDQWFRTTLDGDSLLSPQLLTRLNPGFKDKLKPRSEVIRWAGANGDQVEGILSYPNGYEAGKRYPLMLSIHGGPSGTDFDNWDENWASSRTLLVQRGAFVLQVNYHGSGNYGLEWVESICCGKYYDLERVDLENGVDHLIRLGLVDPDRLGSMGWSNGSILTTELITRSNRYRVASAGAGDVEWISDWGNVDFGASFDNYYFGKPPYEDPDLYIAKSPYFRLKDVTTPTIIYTGTEDTNVPPSQSWSHFRVMQQATSTPVRFVLFPGEPHSLLQYQHQKRKMDEDLAWIDRHLFGKQPDRNEAIKPGSPLASLLEVSRAARVDGSFGTRNSAGLLVPEVVEWNRLQVTRFEITRAQFAAFDPSRPVSAGEGNLPATGVTLDQAKEYAAWLSQRTGQTWRLPGPQEADRLYAGSGEGENTLEYWAGYKPNPEDLEAVRRAVAGMSEGAPLLREVGSFPGRGDKALVFDLGGNAAEWTLDADGRGILRGGSADLPGDLKTKQEAGIPYRGFRLVRVKQD